MIAPHAMAEREQYTDPQRPHHREHHVRTPSGELSHEQRLRRQQAHIRLLTLGLILVLALLAYAAAFDLDHWAEWVVFGGICATAIGIMVAVHSR
jgi:uncharacterized membrane protein YcjF (UPF0283 family)